MTTIERTYAMQTLPGHPGYLLYSNDGENLFLIRKYQWDLGKDGVEKGWGVWRLPTSQADHLPYNHPFDAFEFWTGPFPTRRAAIDAALSVRSRAA